jgi:hypothetical protein
MGIVHHTGSQSNPTVVLKYNAQSAHVRGKHGDDTLLVRTTTRTTQTPTGADCGSPIVTTSIVQHERPIAASSGTTVVPATPAATDTPAAGIAGASATLTSPGKATPAAAPRGGVLGVQATLPTAKPKGGALATTRSVAAARLPFTGIQLWFVLLVGGLLALTGIVLRRTAHGSL